MTSTQTGESRVDTIDCPHCGAHNRVPAASTGVAHCGRCHQPLPWITTAGDGDFEDVVARSTLPVVIDLWAPWCGPCRIVDAGMHKAASKFAGRLKVVKVNVDEAPELAQRFEAQSIPMILFLRGGDVSRTQIGALTPGPMVDWVADALEQS